MATKTYWCGVETDVKGLIDAAIQEQFNDMFALLADSLYANPMGIVRQETEFRKKLEVLMQARIIAQAAFDLPQAIKVEQ
jgi:hypothetical protein